MMNVLARSILLVGFVISPVAMSTGLLEGYQQMLEASPALKSARYDQEAGQEEIALARANLLPQISASGTKNQVSRYIEQREVVGGTSAAPIYGAVRTYNNYPTWTGALNFKMPLFNLSSYYHYLQGNDKADYSDAVYSAKLNDASVKYVQAYLTVVLANESCGLITKQIEALKGNLQLATKSFNGGETTITDIDDAKARLDIATAQLLECQNQLAVSRLKLGDMLGSEVKTVRQIANSFPLEKPDELTLAQWLEVAQKNNPQLYAAEKNIDVSNRELQKSKSQFAPTVDLVASSEKSQNLPSGTNNLQMSRYNSIGLQINIPIFTGGYTSALTRQNYAKLDSAKSNYDATLLAVKEELNSQYLNVVSGIGKIKALETSVSSAERAVYSNKMSYFAGVKTNVDILNAEQQFFQAKRDFSQAKLVYLSSWVSFKAAAGVLTVADIAAIDRYFSSDQIRLVD